MPQKISISGNDILTTCTSDSAGDIGDLNLTSQLAAIALDVKNPPVPSVGLKGGGVDDIQALQNILNGITQPTKLLFPYDNYSFSNTLIINPNLVTLEGYGAKFTFTNASAAFKLKGLGQGYNNILSFIKGIEIIGAGKTVAGTIGIQLGDTSSDYASFVTFENCLIHGFETGITWKSNAWLEKFVRCNIYDCIRPVDYPTGLSNSGEEIVFDQCAIFNSSYGIRCQSAAEIIFSNGSIDYITNRFAEAETGGKIILNNIHMEGNSDSDYWLYTQDAVSSILVKGGVIAVTGAKTAYQIGKSVNSDGGIHLDSIQYVLTASGSYSLPTLITGYGTSRNLLPFANANTLVQSIDSLNYLVNGSFETANTNEWTNNGAAVTPTIDGTTAHTGTNSMKLSATAGNNINVYHDITVTPGQKPRMSAWIKGTLNGTTDWWRVVCQYYDNLGNLISAPTYTKQFDNTNMPTNWTLYYFNPTTPAPAGTVKCRFNIQQFWGNPSDGKGSMWIDDIIITVE